MKRIMSVVACLGFVLVAATAVGQSIEDGTQFQLTESGVQWMQGTVSMFGEEMAEEDVPELDKAIMTYEDGYMINMEAGEPEVQFILGEQEGRTTLAFNHAFLTEQVESDPSMGDEEKQMAIAFLEQILGGMGPLFIAVE